MNVLLRKRCGGAITAVLGSAMLLVALPQPSAMADTNRDPSVGSAASGMASTNRLPDVVAGVVPHRIPGGFLAQQPGSSVKVPATAAGELVVSSQGSSVRIGVPGGAHASGAVAGDGVVFTSARTGTDVLAKARKGGGAQLIAILRSRSAPTKLGFSVDAGRGTSLERNPDGSVSVLTSLTAGDGTAVKVLRGRFAPAWAKDAHGADVATEYLVRGSTLVQKVHTTATTAYPVTADPSFKVGWTGLFVHWYQSEARWLGGLGLAALAAAVGTLCAGPHVALCVAAVASIYYVMKSVSDATVNWMYNHGYRLTTRLTPYFSTYWEKR